MITYTKRLDNALRIAAWAHDKQGQYRKHSDIPYIIHPVGVMMIAANATSDEDILISCLLHDVLEDVASDIYGEEHMLADFGSRVVSIVKDVSKDETITDWKACGQAYLDHLEHQGSDEAIIVCAADKIHNISSVLFDFETLGSEIWSRFTTKNSADQLWWYQSNLEVITKRGAPALLIEQLASRVEKLNATTETSHSLTSA